MRLKSLQLLQGWRTAPVQYKAPAPAPRTFTLELAAVTRMKGGSCLATAIRWRTHSFQNGAIA
eukprot:9482878-Pyramimonas_sp.AAC.1